jgi:hypothetical protein
MSDLVERLRKCADDASLDCYAMCEEAAARIEALEAALRVAQLEAALRVAHSWIDPDLIPEADYALVNAALAPEQDK